MCCIRGGTGLGHRDFTPCPRARLFDGPIGTVIAGMRLLEEVQHVLGAISGPKREKTVIGVLEGSTPPYSDEPRVTSTCVGNRIVHYHLVLPNGLRYPQVGGLRFGLGAEKNLKPGKCL
jgi:hypothetical protein